jgi:DUF1365 family protein
MTAIRHADRAGACLYAGHVWHARETVAAHAFRYRTYMHLFDLDRVGEINRAFRLLGYNRPRAVSLYDADHLDGRPLREAIEQVVVSRGQAWPGGRVLLLTHCRVAGYVFNPVSFFYCLDPQDRLVVVVAEVNNTYGERHVYVLPAPDGAAGEARSHKKEFHVSPFLGLDGTYRFAVDAPGDVLRVGIDLTVGRARQFTARLVLGRKRLSDGALLGMLARYPLVTAQVVAAIHWEALRLWWKGVPFRSKPAYAPESARQTRP